MISYCPLDLQENNPSPKPIVKSYNRNTQKTLENTECNYLVMFFVMGVFILSISDQFKK